MSDNIKQELAAIKAQLAALEAKVDAAADDSPWPKEDDDVWVSFNRVEHYSFDSSRMSYALLEGILFRTEVECQQHHDALCVVEELRRTKGRRAFVTHKGNYGLGISMDMPGVNRLTWITVDGGWQSLYWGTPAERETAVATVGESRILAAAKFFRERA